MVKHMVRKAILGGVTLTLAAGAIGGIAIAYEPQQDDRRCDSQGNIIGEGGNIQGRDNDGNVVGTRSGGRSINAQGEIVGNGVSGQDVGNVIGDQPVGQGNCP